MLKERNITGIVLAGGKSSRMGQDKGVLKLNGAAMVEHVIHSLLPSVSSVLIVANNGNYSQFGYRVVGDVIADCGPMGGIYTGLLHSHTDLNIVVSCDIPLVSAELIAALANAEDDCDVVAPLMNGNHEPLCARYRKSCASKLATHLDSGMFKMRTALKEFNVSSLDPFTISGFTPEQLANINTREELNRFSLGSK